MKTFLQTYFGVLGLVVYAIFAVVIRIPVAAFLLVAIGLYLLIWVPITGNDSNNNWLGDLYDWYRGK